MNPQFSIAFKTLGRIERNFGSVRSIPFDSRLPKVAIFFFFGFRSKYFYFSNINISSTGLNNSPSASALLSAPPAASAPRSALSSAAIRNHQISLTRTKLAQLFDSVAKADPAKIISSTFSVDIGLISIDDGNLSKGSFIIAPGSLTSSGAAHTDADFAEVDAFIFFMVTDVDGGVMNCRYLGLEGESEVITMTGRIRGSGH